MYEGLSSQLFASSTAPYHYSDVIMSAMASQIPASQLFTQPFVQAQIKESIKAPRHCLCKGNSPVTGEFPAKMASNAEKFLFDDVIMALL